MPFFILVWKDSGFHGKDAKNEENITSACDPWTGTVNYNGMEVATERFGHSSFKLVYNTTSLEDSNAVEDGGIAWICGMSAVQNNQRRFVCKKRYKR